MVRIGTYTGCKASKPSVSDIAQNYLTDCTPLPSPPPSYSLPCRLTILSLLILFFQSQLEAPVSSNHQEPGRLQETGEREGGGGRDTDRDRGGRGGNTEFSHHQQIVYPNTSVWHMSLPPTNQTSPLTSCPHLAEAYIESNHSKKGPCYLGNNINCT